MVNRRLMLRGRRKAAIPALPNLAGLVKDTEATAPFPNTALYPPAVGGGRSWRWLLVAFASCCAAGGVAVGAFLWLINLPPKVDCQSVSSLSSDRAQLYCVQAAAESGELADIVSGLELLGQWGVGHPLHSEVQPLVNQWSEAALTAAQAKLSENDLDAAIALVNRIPRSSPTYSVAQGELAAWRQQWQQGEAVFTKAQAALKQRDWATASAQLQTLSTFSNDFWSGQQVQRLSQQIRQEKQAQRLLAQAKASAAPGGTERLSGALRAASQIDQSTYTWQEAQPFLNRWSDLLLGVATDKWYAAELAEAIALSRRAALNPNRQQVAQQLVQLSQARQLALQSVSAWHVSGQQAVSLYRAMLLANQIPPDSRFYPQAQSSVATWKVHLQDLSQLQLAQSVSQAGSRAMLKAAIAQASAIGPDQPRRQQAQTLISHWRKEIQRIEDRPVLAQAHRLAEPNQLEGLRAAIQLAQQIPLGRVMRAEAQNWIYVWNYRAQVIEDQPLLDRAEGFASRGDLLQAIAVASQVQPNRALFDQAQGAIASWNARIRAIELAQQRARQEALALPAPVLPVSPAEPEVLAEPAPDPAATAPQWSPSPSDGGPANDLPSQIETVPPPAPAAPPALSPAPSPAAPPPLAPSAAPGLTGPVPAPISAPPAAPTPAPIETLPPSQLEGGTSQSQLPPPAVWPQPEVVYLGALYAGW